MRDGDKPFVCTRGHASFNIAPRNRTGWLYMAVWLIPAFAIAGVYSWIMETGDGDTQGAVIATVGFFFAITAWAVVMGRWMYVRSEVVDLRKR